MDFNLTIETDNAAFADDDGATPATGSDWWSETARILRTLANRLEHEAGTNDEGRCFDLNGNTVGRWTFA